MNTEKFIKYNSIENHYGASFIGRVSREIPEDTVWVAMQKIHGTNFQVIIDGEEILFAKRSGIIDETESFNGHHEVMRPYMEVLKGFGKSLNGMIINLFGELAGDGIQKNTPYGKKDFFLFDVIMRDKNTGYISQFGTKATDIISIAGSLGLKISPIIKTGKLAELIELNPEFISICPEKSVPSLYLGRVSEMESGTFENLPEFTEEGKGTAEGYVFKPMHTTFLSNGSRAIIKKKSVSHTEKKAKKTPKVHVPVSDNDKELISTLASYSTTARVGNVLSHGEVVLSDKTFGKVSGLVMKDILTEYMREHESDNPLSLADDSKVVSKTVISLIIKDIHKYWQENQ